MLSGCINARPGKLAHLCVYKHECQDTFLVNSILCLPQNAMEGSILRPPRRYSNAQEMAKVFRPKHFESM